MMIMTSMLYGEDGVFVYGEGCGWWRNKGGVGWILMVDMVDDASTHGVFVHLLGPVFLYE